MKKLSSQLRSHSIVLFFSKPLGVRCLRYLLKYILPKYPDLRIAHIYLSQRDKSYSQLKRLAEQASLPYTCFNDLDQKNNQTVHQELQASLSKADLGLIIGFPHKLPAEMIMSCPHGIINLHFAPLPYYRGSGTLSQAIINQEKEYGVTFHFVDEKLDTGPIIAITQLPLDQDKTAAQLLPDFEDLAYFFFEEYIESFICEEQVALKQTELLENNVQPILYTRKKLQQLYHLEISWPPEKILRYLRALATGSTKKPFVRILDQKIYLSLDEN